MTEATLVAGLVEALRSRLPSSVVLKHNDGTTAGVPDISVNWRKGTFWLEVKLISPELYHRALQDLMMRRLSRASRARYVIYRDDPEPLTSIFRPGFDEPEVYWPGFKHAQVADYLRDRWSALT